MDVILIQFDTQMSSAVKSTGTEKRKIQMMSSTQVSIQTLNLSTS